MKLADLQAFDAAESMTDEETIRIYVALVTERGDAREIERARETAERARKQLADDRLRSDDHLTTDYPTTLKNSSDDAHDAVRITRD